MALRLVTGYAGRAHISSSDVGSYNIATLGEGDYVLNKGSKFETFYVSANVIRIKDGDLIFQGRHIRIRENSAEDLVISPGTEGMKRNDLVVVRYTKDEGTGIEKAELKIIRGDESENEAKDAEYNKTDITEKTNAMIADFPLYRIPIDGVTIKVPVPLFKVMDTFAEVMKRSKNNESEIVEVKTSLSNKIKETNITLDSKITNINNTIENKINTITGILAKEFILKNKEQLNFDGLQCIIADDRINGNSLADVYFTEESKPIAEKALIKVLTGDKKVTLVAERIPTGTISATILIRVV